MLRFALASKRCGAAPRLNFEGLRVESHGYENICTSLLITLCWRDAAFLGRANRLFSIEPGRNPGKNEDCKLESFLVSESGELLEDKNYLFTFVERNAQQGRRIPQEQDAASQSAPGKAQAARAAED
jgi:hypothetical protein